MSQAVNAFVEQNRGRLLDELMEFLRIPSISTLPEYRADVERAARFVAEALGAAGLEHVAVIPTGAPSTLTCWSSGPCSSSGPSPACRRAACASCTAS